MKIFSGNATLELAKRISQHLGLPLGKANVGRFSDGETLVEILENVRGHDVFLMQSICAPCNDHLMEVMVMADALRRASVASITAVMPYFGYARQDRRVRSARVPITAKVVADMLAAVGVSRLVTVDLHAEQIQGFFHMPVDNVYASPIVLDHMQQHPVDKEDVVIVSPDVGGVMRARAVAKRLNDADLCIVDKRRPSRNQSEVMHVIGSVENRHCVLVDDMVDTAGTLSQAANALKQHGAKTVVAYCTHPVLSGQAVDNILASSLDALFVMDAIPLQPKAQQCEKITVLSLSRLLAETIHRVNQKESVSSMF